MQNGASVANKRLMHPSQLTDSLPSTNEARRPSPDDPRWQLVQRIVSSRSLGRSALLTEFLLYICDRQLRGKEDSITEQRIGVRVFRRAEGYNSSEDNIVRNYARTLRKRLEEYFQTEGAHEMLRLEIPRGGYVPVFLEAEVTLPPAVTAASQESASPALETPGVEAIVPQQPPANPRWREQLRTSGLRVNMLAIAMGSATLLLGILIGGSLRNAHFSSPGRSSVFAATDMGRYDALWSHLFQKTQDTYIVPSDGGLVMMESFTRQPVSLEDYARGTYRNRAAIMQWLEPLTSKLNADLGAKLTHHVEVLGGRRYTSIVDLGLTSDLSRLPAVVPDRLMIRFARDLRIDDLRSGNAILLGSSDANPWVALFQPQLNFRFDDGEDGGSQRIINKHPLPGEQPMYLSDAADSTRQTYGVIALLRNLNDSGYVLIIEGINMAGTQAAGDFITNPERMEPILRQALRPDGTIRPFEVLLSTSDVGANASRPKLLCERIHDN